MTYWIVRWSQLRKKELMSYPNEFPIHDVYKTICTHEELKSGFDELHEIFAHCYEDILHDPTDMMLPIYDMNTDIFPRKQERPARSPINTQKFFMCWDIREN